MAKNVLIVDSDKGFSTMLKEGLNNHPDFSAAVSASSTRALQYVVEKPIDVVIVDMGLADMPPGKLIKAIQDAKNNLPIMVIPLIGQEVPDNIQNLGIQGTLPKPFFVGDLPKLVGAAVGLDLEADTPPPPPQKPSAKKPAPKPKPAPAATPSAEASSPAATPVRTRAISLPTLPSWKLQQLRKNKKDIISQLDNLNSEIRAEVILLTVGTELIAKSGNMTEDRAEELATLVAESVEAASQAAAFLGERESKFEQSLHEGSEFRLYSYSLGQGVVLSLALGTNIPLGILRHQTKQVTQSLMKYIQ